MLTTRSCAVIGLVLALTAPARAQEYEASESTKKPSSYWSTTFQGGVLMPLGQMTEEYQYSLAGALRIGWTSRIGLGLDLATEYSPLSRKRDPLGQAYETHFVTASLMPRFTLGKKTLRLWVAGGGGLAYERQKPTAPVDPAVTATNRYAPAAIGAAGLELHFLAGVGLAAIGSYTRTFGDVEYELANLTGALTFTFD